LVRALRVVVGLVNASSNIALRASTAFSLVWNIARSLLALQLALGTSAVGRFDAFVLAIQFFADWRAFRIRRCACGVALRRCANCFTLWAAILLALIFRATNRADRFFAMNNTFSTRSLFTSHLTFRTSAHWVANSRARRIIALPTASRVALFSSNKSNK